jgi:hypothetical protein
VSLTSLMLMMKKIEKIKPIPMTIKLRMQKSRIESCIVTNSKAAIRSTPKLER